MSPVPDARAERTKARRDAFLAHYEATRSTEAAAVIDAIEETFLAHLPSAALGLCAEEDVIAGLAAMRTRFDLEDPLVVEASLAEALRAHLPVVDLNEHQDTINKRAWYSRCGCGWETPYLDTELEAEIAASRHVALAITHPGHGHDSAPAAAVPEAQDGRGWRHARWVEPHKASPDLHGISQKLETACMTCGEVLHASAAVREGERERLAAAILRLCDEALTDGYGSVLITKLRALAAPSLAAPEGTEQ